MSEADKHVDCSTENCQVYGNGQKPCKVQQGICPDMACLAQSREQCRYPGHTMCIHDSGFRTGDRVTLVKPHSYKHGSSECPAKVGESGTVQYHDEEPRHKYTPVHFDSAPDEDEGWWVDNLCLEAEAPSDAQVEKAIESISRSVTRDADA